MLIQSMLKKLLGLPSESLHDLISGLSEEDKARIIEFAKILVKEAAKGAVEGAINSQKQ